MNKYKKLLIIFMVFVIVLVPCVAYAEETTTTNNSSFVTYTDGKSYEGLPSFPTYRSKSTSQGTLYTVFTDYVLFSNKDRSMYYLACFDNYEGNLYIDGNAICGNGKYRWYLSDLTTVIDTFSGSDCSVYYCGSGASSWTFENNSAGYVCNYFLTDEEIISSTCNIYDDSSCTTVFTRPTVGPLVLGVSSEKIVKMMMTETVGLLPLVIGLVVLVTAFWKGYRMLRVVLQGA